jgi:hypothetical protein
LHSDTGQQTSQNENINQQTTDYTYQSGELQQTGQINAEEDAQTIPTGDSISWSASEFVQHDKNKGWHLYIGIGAVLVAIAVYLLTRSIFGAVVMVIVGVILAISGNLKPRMINYTISPEGITANDKHFGFMSFKSFCVIDDGGHPNLQLLPQKRFAIPITMYFDPNNEDQVVSILGEYLPFEHRERDFVDKLSTRLKF